MSCECESKIHNEINCHEFDKSNSRNNKTTQIAFDFMQSLIKVLQKQSIEKVVEFGEVKMKACKKVVQKA